MAKASGRKRQTKVSVTETQFTLTDAGIPGYVRRHKVGERKYEITQADRAAELQLLNDQTRRLNQKLSQAEQLARAAISPHVRPWNGKVDDILAGYQGTALDLGDGKRSVLVPVDQSEELREALDVLRMATGLRGAVVRNPESAYWFAQAYVLGMLHERMIVWPSTDDALIGKESRAIGKAASAERSRQSKQRQEWVYREYRNTLSADPKKDKAAARKRVLERFAAQFPNAKSPKPSTIENWIREQRKLQHQS